MGRSDVLMFLMFFLFISFVSAENGLIFYVTDNVHNGNFVGRSGADSFCASNIPTSLNCGNIHAFLSVDSSDEIRDMPSNYGYSLEKSLYWYNPSTRSFIKFAENWNDAMDASVGVSARNGTGMDLYMGAYWTGSYADGSSDEIRDPGYGTCNAWKNKSYQRYGTSSNGKEKDFRWIYKTGKYTCSTKHRLACVCKGSIKSNSENNRNNSGYGVDILHDSSDIYILDSGVFPYPSHNKGISFSDISDKLFKITVQQNYFHFPKGSTHNTNEIFVSVDGVESTLHDALELRRYIKTGYGTRKIAQPLCGSKDSHYLKKVKLGHTADEVLIKIKGVEKTLQKAINDGDFCCIDSSWSPNPANYCHTSSILQSSNCGSVRETPGQIAWDSSTRCCKHSKAKYGGVVQTSSKVKPSSYVSSSGICCSGNEIHNMDCSFHGKNYLGKYLWYCKSACV